MPRGSLVHRAPAVGRVLRHMRSDVHPPKFSYEFPRVVVLVSSQRDALSSGVRFRHEHGSIPLRSARRLGQKGLHQKPVAVFHQYMSHIAQLRLASAGLGVQPGIRIGGRFMGLVLSLFSAKVDISARFGRPPGPVLGSETLMTCPSFDQRSVHGEMFIRHVRLGSFQHPLDGQIVGGGGIVIADWPGYPGENHAARAWILNMYTEPGARRCGVAKRLLEVMIEWCRTKGFSAVSLHASTAGRPLYETAGFQQTNEMMLKL